MQQGRGGLTKCIYRPPGVRGPTQEALGKGGVHLPAGWEGALRQSLRVAYPGERGQLPLLPLFQADLSKDSSLRPAVLTLFFTVINLTNMYNACLLKTTKHF